MKIVRLKNTEIDFKAYDNCIKQSLNGTVYALSWYLDAVSPGWELLLTEDYQYVMPLPIRKKYGIEYIIQPLFCQQLGLFSSQFITGNIFNLFCKNIPGLFYVLQVNEKNLYQGSTNLTFRDNFILGLRLPYETIRSAYSKNAIRNLKKTSSETFILSEQTDDETYWEILRKNNKFQMTEKELDLLKGLVYAARKNIQTSIWNIRNENQEILSCALFFFWKERIYYLMPVSTPKGIKKISMLFLMDKFIQKHSQSQWILDFEGSSIENVARFYQGFGADDKPYGVIKRENLYSKVFSFMKNHSVF